jgi:hypothetical protein
MPPVPPPRVVSGSSGGRDNPAVREHARRRSSAGGSVEFDLAITQEVLGLAGRDTMIDAWTADDTGPDALPDIRCRHLDTGEAVLLAEGTRLARGESRTKGIDGSYPHQAGSSTPDVFAHRRRRALSHLVVQERPHTRESPTVLSG